MSTNGSPPKTANMAPTGGLFGSEQRPDYNMGASDNHAGNTPNKDTQFGQPTNQFPPPPGHSYPPSQPPFPGAPQFYHHASFNMTPSSQPSYGTTQGYASYGPQWQGYDFPQGGYSGPQMFPLSAIHRTGAVISRRTSSSSSTAWKHCSRSADLFLLDSIRTTSRRTWETPHQPPNETISAGSRTAHDRCCRDCGLAPIARDYL
jgi:hypothetical protein